MSNITLSDGLTLDNKQENNSNDHERKVIVQQYGNCDAIDPQEWPHGEFLSNLCRNYADRLRSSTMIASRSTADQSESVDEKTNHDWWQVSARRAMLEKFGYSLSRSDNANSDYGKKSSDWTFSPGETGIVQSIWKNLVNEIVDQRIGSANSTADDTLHPLNESANPNLVQNDFSLHHLDFIDFVLSQCCKSNNRQLQWSVMSCPRGVQFPLHAHPNLELIYCIRGELFEVRMHGEPITRTFEKSDTRDDLKSNSNVIGPDLTYLRRNWSFGTLKTGEWLVNEIGSVHKSFTSAKSDGGCDLLVLWGGSHANIVHPPISPNIQNVVDAIEDKLRIEDYCCINAKNHFVSETFLPDSER